jgi:hypothetical protein
LEVEGLGESFLIKIMATITATVAIIMMARYVLVGLMVWGWFRFLVFAGFSVIIGLGVGVWGIVGAAP